MKRFLHWLFCFIVFNDSALCEDKCFIAKEKEQILKNEGECNKRHSPMSTFKILLSLIGFDSGILADEMHPVWAFQEGYDDWKESWRQPQTPKSWMKESCVWYSQVLTKKLGIQKFQDYIRKINYGNNDVSGDKDKNNAPINNGLTNSWLCSSLEISALEQIAFLEKMLEGKLPIKSSALLMTKKIMFLEELSYGWKLYGKTGTGHLINPDGTKNSDIYHGWFVGWIEKDGRRIIFACHISDKKKEKTFPSLRAKMYSKAQLIKIIDEIEKNSTCQTI